jgi:hypothetical protein
VTVFLGGGFAAKYLCGGGNFSLPLQWMLVRRSGIRRRGARIGAKAIGFIA